MPSGIFSSLPVGGEGRKGGEGREGNKERGEEGRKEVEWRSERKTGWPKRGNGQGALWWALNRDPFVGKANELSIGMQE